MKSYRTGLSYLSITEPGVRVLLRRLSLLVGACGFPDEQRRVCSHLEPEVSGSWYSLISVLLE